MTVPVSIKRRTRKFVAPSLATLILIATAAVPFITSASAQDLRLSVGQTSSDAVSIRTSESIKALSVNLRLPFQLSLPSNTGGYTVLQASGDLRSWVNIRTNSPGQINFIDYDSPFLPQRFYRLVNVNQALSDLSQQPNTVFAPAEGFDTVQFSKSGKLGLIAWAGQKLIYRERSLNGAWLEEVICQCGGTYTAGTREEYRFQPPAALFFDSASTPHVLKVSGGIVAHHIRQSNGQWTEAAQIKPVPATSSVGLFVAAIGPGDVFHIALIGSGSSPALIYGSNKPGAWQWSNVTTIAGNPRGFLAQGYAPRFFSLAVDAQNFAHLVFTPEFKMPQGSGGYLRPYSELHYASNRSGQWSTQKVFGPPDDSGDAGAGASIAMGPDNQPAIASWLNDRASTGSSQVSRLYFHRQNSNGSWTTEKVAETPDGYAAGDGPKGTGFAPYLRFDASGRPQIAFSDHAAEHFPTSGQNEFAGQIRLARHDGVRWNFKTVFQQREALKAQIIYPAMATWNGETVFTALERQTQWQAPDFRSATSTYRFRLITDVR